ncbi:conserved membrane hypothetical protein [Candidatus Terasakiella magnetica]|nr:conserved membrane hypothetical protein [Candidatus Terasakiella magnetica]
MLSALFKAFAQLSDLRLRRVLKIGILAALGCWAALAFTASLVVRHTRFFDAGWADAGTSAVLGLVALLLPMLFFSALATFVMSFMLDGVAEVVEAEHYPGLPPARIIAWPEMLVSSLRFLAVMALVTALAAPVYLALLFFGLGILLNYMVNGYLLGREYFELIAARRLDASQVRIMRHAHMGRLWLCGAVINLLFQIPLLNLAAPVLATSFMIHVFQSLQPAPASV